MTGEQISHREKALTRTERARLVKQMGVHGRRYWMPRLKLADRSELTELMTIAAFLNISDNASEQGHLRRMAGIEAQRVSRIETYPGDREFWSYIDQQLEIELGGEEELTADMADLPRRWQAAANDLLKLETEILGS